MIDNIEIAVTYTIKRNQLEALHWVDRYIDRTVCESIWQLYKSDYDTMGRRGFRYDTQW